MVNQRALCIIPALLLSFTLIFGSQQHLIYAGINSISSGNQINPIATHNNIESKTFQWDQKDTNANQVGPGIYKAQTTSVRNNTSNNTQLSMANTTFTIKG